MNGAHHALAGSSQEPDCKANLGNLMQHWVFCETLDRMRRTLTKNQTRLLYFNAYSMAPFSRPETSETSGRSRFMNVQQQLPGRKSTYEKTWHELQEDKEGCYPSSALFVHRLWKERWKRDLTLVLCETNKTKAEQIKEWLTGRGYDEGSIHNQDWRQVILNIPPETSSAHALLLSFDPFRFESDQGDCEGNLYPDDLDRLRKMSELENIPILVQISSYYNGGGKNPHDKVEKVIWEKLRWLGFRGRVRITANEHMMSLVLWKNQDLSRYLLGLPEGFSNWIQHF
jgi:hypothetical protein